MAKKLYVGNLSYQTDEDSLRGAFEAVGEVLSVKIITDETGRSKGFGFVEMSSDDEAKTAISALSGSTLGGRNIIVNEARPQTERGLEQAASASSVSLTAGEESRGGRDTGTKGLFRSDPSQRLQYRKRHAQTKMWERYMTAKGARRLNST